MLKEFIDPVEKIFVETLFWHPVLIKKYMKNIRIVNTL
ncbi:MAG: hypothetical protein BAJALOKI1v1_540013 [Promethearchaeota archaeon]|nr:MAG: hypothetical protein BAJALOKI1v1_540013 [Candidatus Lokiarchaeota archaeon]